MTSLYTFSFIAPVSFNSSVRCGDPKLDIMITTASKIPAEDKKARLAVMKIPMALKVANQSIDKISKQDNESLQAVLDGEKPPAQGGEAEEPAANRREVEEAVIFDLSELLKNEM